MLNNTLEVLVKLSFLNSDRRLNFLLNSSQHIGINFNSYLCVLDKISAPIRRESIEFELDTLQIEDTKTYSLNFIKLWQTNFLQWQGNHFVVNQTYLDNWLSLTSVLDPGLLIGYSYSELIKNEALNPVQLAEINQCLQAIPLNKRDSFADNHAHLGGHGSQRKAIVDFSFLPTKSVSQASTIATPCVLSSLILVTATPSVDSLSALFAAIF